LKTLLLLCSFMLSACCWEHQIALHPGDASISRNSICISSSGGKILSGYGVDGRRFDDHSGNMDSLVSKSLIAQTPYCFKVKLDTYMFYNLHYTLDDIHYNVDFVTDGSPNVLKRDYSN